jgi:hypothetical protein
MYGLRRWKIVVNDGLHVLNGDNGRLRSFGLTLGILEECLKCFLWKIYRFLIGELEGLINLIENGGNLKDGRIGSLGCLGLRRIFGLEINRSFGKDHNNYSHFYHWELQ